MILHAPFSISARLLPSLEIGDATISIEPIGIAGHRTQLRYFIDLPDGSTYAADDLSLGMGGDLVEGFASLLSFLSACAESRAYGRRNRTIGENSDLFPDNVGEWAESISDELDILAFELETASPNTPLIEV